MNTDILQIVILSNFLRNGIKKHCRKIPMNMVTSKIEHLIHDVL